MKTEERRSLIVRLLNQTGTMRVTDLIERLGASGPTIRRDLQELEQRGLVQRSHGHVSASSTPELPFQGKMMQMVEEKRRIALRAAELITPGVIGLSGGTTAACLAMVLREGQELSVVTNAVNIAMTLADNEQIQVVLIGGRVRPRTYELVGTLSDLVLPHLTIDQLFLGVDGLSLNGGITTHNDLEAYVNRAMLERARQVVVIADHTKIGRVTLATIAPLNRVHTLITDTGADPAQLDEIRAVGVNVITA